MLRYTAISHGYECVSLLRLYNSSMTQVCKYIRNNNGVSLKALFSTSFRNGLKSQVDILTAEPKLPFLIRKHHFRTSNEGTLSCFIKSLFSLKWLNALYYEEHYEREMDIASVITCIWYSIHSSAQSHIHNKTLVWMSAEESDIFVVLSFHLLRVISDDRAAQWICWMCLTTCCWK